jgi:hypothetical protein
LRYHPARPRSVMIHEPRRVMHVGALRAPTETLRKLSFMQGSI